MLNPTKSPKATNLTAQNNMELSTSMIAKLADLTDRFEEVSALLSDSETMSDRDKFTALSKEFAEIEPVVLCYQRVNKLNDDLEESSALLDDDDADLRELAEQEIAETKTQLESLNQQLQTLLLPKDPNDKSNVFLEIRAGTGGDEAAIFSGDLFRMYSKFAEAKGWRIEIMNERPGEHGGYKEIISRIEGNEVYSQLKFESGAHRVQRVPETESQAAYIPLPAPLRSCPKSPKSTQSKLIKRTFAKTPFERLERADSTSIKPIPPFASPTYPPVPL